MSTHTPAANVILLVVQALTVLLSCTVHYSNRSTRYTQDRTLQKTLNIKVDC